MHRYPDEVTDALYKDIDNAMARFPFNIQNQGRTLKVIKKNL